MQGQSNFRDIGGYRTIDGHTVKWGQVYRSGELPRLTNEDVAILKELELRMVHNFLLEEEIAQRGEDRLPEETTLVKNPIKTSADDLVIALLDARKTGDFSMVPGQPPVCLPLFPWSSSHWHGSSHPVVCPWCSLGNRT